MANERDGNSRPSILPEMCQQCPVRVAGPCKTLSDAALANLARSASPKVVPRHTSIIRQGDQMRYFYFLRAGAAKAIRSLANGRQTVVEFYLTNDVIGLSENEGYTFSATAVSDVLLCRFDRAAVFHAGKTSPTLIAHLFGVASQELIAAQTQMLALGQLSAPKRLAAFLVGWCHRTHIARAARTRVDLPITRSDLAEYLGVATETISRALRELRQARLIETDRRNQIVIIDMAALERITGLEHQ